ncbi:MAG: hypothetical protein MRY49_02475 [Candidatus Pacebacteria bacterium]|nr:hypothetical protein [Candidatus Paceibacterota bacterium]
MENKDLEYFKTKLESELQEIIKELQHVGRINPDNPKDWEATPDHLSEEERTDENEVADKIEGFESNTAILKQLEIRFNEIKSALERIEKGTYGMCEVSKKEIERDRLEANPAARTCKAEMNN